MVFVTAFLWGTGISLGMCVGLVAWAILRPMTPGYGVVREVDRISLEALNERNRLTEETNKSIKRIADGLWPVVLGEVAGNIKDGCHDV